MVKAVVGVLSLVYSGSILAFVFMEWRSDGRLPSRKSVVVFSVTMFLALAAIGFSALMVDSAT